jgi:plasmid stabilization system protein ParE
LPNDLRESFVESAMTWLLRRSSWGRLRPELGPDLRSHPHKSYVIFFRYVGGVLEIVNILEGHRDIDAFFHGGKR